MLSGGFGFYKMFRVSYRPKLQLCFLYA